MLLAATPFSFTEIRTGFRRPARTKFSTSCVCVAEKRPVLLCFGKNSRIVFMLETESTHTCTHESARAEELGPEEGRLYLNFNTIHRLIY